jgi:hypothetical protein
MSTNNTESLRFKILTTGREEFDNRQKSNFRPMTLQRLYDWIDAKNLDDAVKKELKKSAGNYPQQALESWQKKFDTHLSHIQVQLRRVANAKANPSKYELGDEPKDEIGEMPLDGEFDVQF